LGPKHKLTPGQVAELCQLRQQGLTIKELMNRYQIGKTSVYRHLNSATEILD
jgi:DNA-binding CsgD family transcriptional regulator